MDYSKFIETFFVPGGRFMLAFEYHRLSMWDMVPRTGGDDAVELHPRQVLDVKIDLEEVLAARVVAATKILSLVSIGSM